MRLKLGKLLADHDQIHEPFESPNQGLRYGWFVLLAVVPQLLGHGSLNYALQHVSATMVAVCILAEPIGASILAMIFLKETPGGLQVVGGLIILAGIYLASRRPVGGQPAEIID